MYYDLSKKEKKIARVCIDKGLDDAFKNGLEKCAAVISNWRQGKFTSNREAYQQLFAVLSDEDGFIARRYDGLTGSRWLMVVAQLFSEKVITEEDIKEFSDKPKDIIRAWAK